MRTIIAEDKNLERHGFLARVVRIFTVPLINILPVPVLKKIMALNHDARRLLSNMGSAEAMEVMYSRYDRPLFSAGIAQGILNLFWHNCVSNPKAIRNRLKIVEGILEKEILRIKTNRGKEGIVILTIGGGSGRSAMEVINKLSREDAGAGIKVIDVEINSDAIELSKKRAANLGLVKIFKWINNKAENIGSLIPKESADICEMIGVLDYLPEEEGVKTISQIHKSLKKRGLFITGNICPNKEHKILFKIGWPKMYYREPAGIAGILEKSGFSLDKATFIFEPLKNHIITVVRK